MKTINKILLFALAILCVSCEDIFEEDISNDTLQTISPQNNEEVESNVVNFQWTAIDGADDYRIQVYASNQAMVLDSLVSQTNFTYALAEGDYQWRVRGENFAYQSAYSLSSNFSMIESDVLTTQHVILSNPSNNFYTNDTSVICTWQAINTATSYELELTKIIGPTSTVVLLQPNITTTSVTLSNALTDDAKYEWKIRAVNSTSMTQTQYSSRTFSVDRNIPNQPVNNLPATNSIQTAAQSIDFSWTPATDTGIIQSPVSYSVEFSNSSTFTSLIRTSPSDTASLSEVFTASGDYYWRVKTIDLAGNHSTYSTPFKFTIN